MERRSNIEVIVFAFWLAIALALLGWIGTEDRKQEELTAAYQKEAVQAARVEAEKKARDLRMRGSLKALRR